MKPKSIKNLALTAGVLAIILYLCGHALWSAVSYAATTVVALFTAYDLFLWRINPLEKQPKIYGTYTAYCHSTHNNGYDYTSKVTIRQTHSTVTVLEELTDGSHCESLTGNFIKITENGDWMLYYSYLTHPNPGKGDDMHQGTAMLRYLKSGELQGTYYTNRIVPTSGTMLLKKQNN